MSTRGWGWGFGLMWVMLASCATPPASETGSAGKPLDNLVEVQSSQKTGAKALKKGQEKPRELTLVQPQLQVREPEHKGPRFTLSARDVDVKSVLIAIANEIPQNVIIDPKITLRTTVDLKEVTLEQALENILTPLKLKYEIDKNFIRVSQKKMQTRIFHLNYILSQRRGSSNLSSSSGGGTSQTTQSTGSTTTGTTSSGSSSGSSARSQSSIFSTEQTNVWTEIVSNLQQMVTPSTQSAAGFGQEQNLTSASTGGSSTPNAESFLAGLTGQGAGSLQASASTQQTAPIGIQATTAASEEQPYFSVNRQGGVIIVKDYPEVLLQVAEMLEAIEGSIQRQVFIQAKIVEVTLNDQYRLGIDWSAVSPITLASSTSGAGTILGGLENATLTGAAGLTYGVANANFNLVVDALSQQGDVSVLSSPKIATLNNQRAVIKVGTEDVFFSPEVTPATTTSAATTVYTPESVTIGIVLDVVPQINANGMIMMSINTSITERAGERTSPDNVNVVPILDVREANNVVLSRSGQTIVIGGLMKTKKEEIDNALPLLGDIPILGRLFQRKLNTEEKTELVIMLTPEVMVGQGIDDRFNFEDQRLRQVGYVDPLTNPLPERVR